IGTIHSLCAEILRAHPAEAGLDPAFSVLEEGLVAALQAESIHSALAWAATDSQSAALFGVFKENDLRQILNALMNRRLDVASSLDLELTAKHAKSAKEELINLSGLRGSKNHLEQFSSALASYLATHLDSPLLAGEGLGVRSWQDCLSTLASHHSSSPEDKLELARQSVLACWDEIQEARAAQDWDAVLASLAALRKATSTQGKKDNWNDIEPVRAAMTELREIYDEHLKFLSEKARFSLDEKLAAHLPAVCRLFDQTLREYQRRKDARQSLDFDDLEGLTAQLLSEHPDVRARWQSELRAVLVDEFQDTNERQRQIVYALTGFSPLLSEIEGKQTLKSHREDAKNAKEKRNLSALSGLRGSENQDKAGMADLFIVGDSKQSIYRFRNADVTVFRQVQNDIRAAGGLALDLDLTFRAHKPLLETLNTLLAPILGETDDPARPYAVPFAPLRAYRQSPACENIQPPYIEFHLGLGQDAEEGRAVAASALAHRLRQLRETEGFAWGEMALLFRSSTAYAAYETALEQAGIPFVTVAGRGFY
ncbi:MAG: hypothetical protein C0393_08585, partial [Anaerolinea sp.]|nr:hypothetical protein [Anaerolinea sp.]